MKTTAFISRLMVAGVATSQLVGGLARPEDMEQGYLAAPVEQPIPVGYYSSTAPPAPAWLTDLRELQGTISIHNGVDLNGLPSYTTYGLHPAVIREARIEGISTPEGQKWRLVFSADSDHFHRGLDIIEQGDANFDREINNDDLTSVLEKLPTVGSSELGLLLSLWRPNDERRTE